MSKKITIVIADDHQLYRDGLANMLRTNEDFRVIGEAANGNLLIMAVSESKPDVVITDIRMPVIDGIEATKFILRESPGTHVIGLSMFADDEVIIGMIGAGAEGYLLKNVDNSEIQRAIHAVMDNKPYFCKEIEQTLSRIKRNKFTHRPQSMVTSSLTDREKSIVVLICEGMTNKEIAGKLSISYRTVEGIRNDIMNKIGVKNTAGLIIAAVKNQWYKPQ